jgi:hypothetical protein
MSLRMLSFRHPEVAAERPSKSDGPRRPGRILRGARMCCGRNDPEACRKIGWRGRNGVPETIWNESGRINRPSKLPYGPPANHANGLKRTG